MSLRTWSMDKSRCTESSLYCWFFSSYCAMSRCFPFPPPGYERKTSTGSAEASKKEKSKEEKSKKEKRDKEKREGKDKKHKDRSKEKHGEKKDRKENNDRKKKDKDREKRRDRISNEKTLDEQTRNHHGENFHATSPGKNINSSKSGSWIAQDGTGKQMAGNSVCKPIYTSKMAEKGIRSNVNIDRSLSVHEKKSRVMGNALVEEFIDNDSMVNNFINGDSRSHVHTSRKMEGGSDVDTKIDKKITVNDERRIARVATINNNMANNSGNAEQKRHVNIDRKLVPGEKRFGAMGTMLDEKSVIHSNMVTNSTTAGQGQQIGSSRMSEKGRDADTKMDRNHRILASSIEKGFGGMDNLLSKGDVSNITSDKFVGAEQEGFGGFGVLPKKETDKRVGEKERSKDRGSDMQKKDQHKDKKKYNGDRDKRKEKKKEKHKMRDKKEHKDQKHIAETAKIDVPSMKSPLPHQDIEMCNANLKRKQNNGFLLEDDVGPYKLRRMASFTHLPVENGRKPDIHHVAVPPYMSNLHGGESNMVLEGIPDDKEPTTNGDVNAQLPGIVAAKSNPPTDINKASEVSKKPHRDEKYLSQIHSVPKMEEWLEVDDQEWLFGGKDPRHIPKLKLTDAGTPLIWSKALRIEEADVLALPYVIPY